MTLRLAWASRSRHDFSASEKITLTGRRSLGTGCDGGPRRRGRGSAVAVDARAPCAVGEDQPHGLTVMQGGGGGDHGAVPGLDAGEAGLGGFWIESGQGPGEGGEASFVKLKPAGQSFKLGSDGLKSSPLQVEPTVQQSPRKAGQTPIQLVPVGLQVGIES